MYKLLKQFRQPAALLTCLNVLSVGKNFFRTTQNWVGDSSVLNCRFHSTIFHKGISHGQNRLRYCYRPLPQLRQYTTQQGRHSGHARHRNLRQLRGAFQSPGRGPQDWRCGYRSYRGGHQEGAQITAAILRSGDLRGLNRTGLESPSHQPFRDTAYSKNRSPDWRSPKPLLYRRGGDSVRSSLVLIVFATPWGKAIEVFMKRIQSAAPWVFDLAIRNLPNGVFWDFGRGGNLVPALWHRASEALNDKLNS
jgi:hypothetical protein